MNCLLRAVIGKSLRSLPFLFCSFEIYHLSTPLCKFYFMHSRRRIESINQMFLFEFNLDNQDKAVAKPVNFNSGLSYMCSLFSGKQSVGSVITTFCSTLLMLSRAVLQIIVFSILDKMFRKMRCIDFAKAVRKITDPLGTD